LDSALASESGVDGINEQTLDKENQDPVPDPDEFDGMFIHIIIENTLVVI